MVKIKKTIEVFFLFRFRLVFELFQYFPKKLFIKKINKYKYLRFNIKEFILKKKFQNIFKKKKTLEFSFKEIIYFFILSKYFQKN